MHPLFVGGDIDRNSSYGPKHRLSEPRVSVAIDLCRTLGWLPESMYRDAPMATDAELIRFHDPDYIAALTRAERDQTVSDQTVSDQTVSEQTVSEQTVSEQAVSEQAVSEQAVSEQVWGRFKIGAGGNVRWRKR